MKKSPRRTVKPAEIVPSILAADFAHLARDAAAVQRGGAVLLHVDVMDGHFVPNITLGQPVVASLHAATKLPLDLHLMIEKPECYLDDFARAGAKWISVHQEACPHLHRTIGRIRDLGLRAGVAINPATPVHLLEDVIADLDYVLVMSVNPGFGGQKFILRTIEKVRAVSGMIARSGSRAEIEIDGGVSLVNAREIVEAGARWLVAGSSVFGTADAAAAVRALTRRARGGAAAGRRT